jgi:hypothetical protein
VKVAVAHSIRNAWWRRFHPLVRVGFYVATAGRETPPVQTALGLGMVATGIALRRSQKSRNRLIYRDKVSPGKTMRIRVYRGTAPPSEVTVRT